MLKVKDINVKLKLSQKDTLCLIEKVKLKYVHLADTYTNSLQEYYDYRHKKITFSFATKR